MKLIYVSNGVDNKSLAIIKSTENDSWNELILKEEFVKNEGTNVVFDNPKNKKVVVKDEIKQAKKRKHTITLERTSEKAPLVLFTFDNFVRNKHRFNLRKILQHSNATPIRTHVIGSGYICSFCKAHFPKAADLKTHTIQDHDDLTKYKFVKSVRLTAYLLKLDITSLKCNICEALVDTLELLIEHLNDAHQKGLHTDIKSNIMCFKLDGEALRCFICSTEYNSFKKLQEHTNKHINNHICVTCGAGFVTNRQLGMHAESHKAGVYKCGTCAKIFPTSMKLKSHERCRHQSILNYKCYQCGERYSKVNERTAHMKEAHGGQFAELKCDACERTFKSTNTLRRHRNRDHLMERRFPCEQCAKRFFTKSQLQNHEVTHTGLREFACKVCAKSFTRKYTLTEHMRSHTNDRRFICNFCDMAFLQKCSLKGHLRSKHNEYLE